MPCVSPRDKCIEFVFQVDIDFEKDPIGVGKDGKNVYLRDIWPSTEEVTEVPNRNLADHLTKIKDVIL